MAPDAPTAARGTPAPSPPVIDGDTIDVQGQGRIRLIGIDTPEQGECGHDEAIRVLSHLILGQTVTLVPGVQDDRDKYDRLVR